MIIIGIYNNNYYYYYYIIILQLFFFMQHNKTFLLLSLHRRLWIPSTTCMHATSALQNS